MRNAYKDSPLIKNILLLISGTVVAQIIAISVSPIITRIYGPEEYGVLGVFISIVAVLIPIAALQFPIAIVIANNSKEAYGLYKLSVLVSLIIAGILLLTIIFAGKTIIQYLNLSIPIYYLYLLPLVVVFSSIFQSSQQLIIRYKMFKQRASVTVQQSIILHSSNIIFGLIRPYGSTLIIIYTVSLFIHGYLLMMKLKSKSLKDEIIKIVNSNISMRLLSKRYYDFPKYRAPQVLINNITQNTPLFVLTSFFGPSSAGFYLIAKKVLEVPVNLVGNAVGDVFYPRITEAYNKNENTYKLLLLSNISLGVIGVIPFTLIIFYGESLFSFVYGIEWERAGSYAKWLSFYLFFMFITRTTIKVIPVYGIQKFHLNFTILASVINIMIMLVFTVIFKNDILAIKVYSISSGIMYFLLFLVVLFIGFSKEKKRSNI
ncbi:lipopolysaccharide biosynthesis protein [Salinicoccus roseus]|uniref:lipopolysaccharide biosynthesis protein n=1 Tax=Salinicoccus roseus TaxID=45670 RepID=UPI001EF4CB01|nr:oligosaccharide flippase family protein [Salinicoccus roseus]